MTSKRIFSGLFIVLFFICTTVLYSCSYGIDYDFADYVKDVPENIKIETCGDVIIVTPETYQSGFVFYPGAYVTFEAYLPLMVKCAEKGIKCFLVNMPEDLAFFNLNAADKYLKSNKDIKNWYVGGHSLGGAMSASYVAKRKSKYKGLILLAAYSTADLTKSKLKVLSIYGSEDGVLGMEKYNSNLGNLPADYEEHVIAGGNHAGFGNYGTQKGDKPAKISNEEQQTITADFIGNFVKKLIFK